MNTNEWENAKKRVNEYFYDSEHSLTKNQVQHIWVALIEPILSARTEEVIEMVEGIEMRIPVDEYTSEVKKAQESGAAFDRAFDYGVEKFRKEVLTALRSSRGEERNK